MDAQPRLHVGEVGSACSLGLRAEADLVGLARPRRSEPHLREARQVGADLMERMRSAAEEVATERPYYLPLAQAWLAACEAEFARLEGASAPDLWASSVAAWDALGRPYYKAYALMREGEAALAGRRDRERAARALHEARQIAVQLGAEPLRQAIDTLARRSGTRVAERRGDGLSVREREVLALVAAGRSNSEIGEVLFISKKTASVHVANIKAKLGAQSRIEIAMSAVGRGLLETR
jgi:DNA-binding CsgD family transcriptional regulator